MKASELRIGNYVALEMTDSSFDAVEVTGISYKRVLFRYNKNQEPNEDTIMKAIYCNIKPVELTEEWLLKFGFEKPAHSWMCDKFHLTEWDEYPLNWCVAFNKNGAIIVEKLQYVHQLQNLYHALTGEELTIK